MRTAGAILQVLFFVCVLAGAGCEPVATELPSEGDNGFNHLSVYASYSPVRISIMPLTEFVCVGNNEEVSGMKVYVSLLDAFGSQMKSPAVFRFELYERVLRAAEPKGRRVVIWPDIDLTEPNKNNEYWRDFLRAYEFDLDFEPGSRQSYILQVTSLCPNGRRLSSEFGLKDR